MNPNTVARAYRELEHEGVIELRHGLGTFVSDSITARTRVMRKAQAIVQSAVERLSTLDLSEDEIRRLVENELACSVLIRMRKGGSMSDFVIETAGLRKSFKEKAALNGLDLTVPAGSIFGFLGRNGAGKTTTIKLLLGMLNFDSGIAKVFGLPISNSRNAIAARQRIGFVSEEKELYPYMTVEQIIRFTRPFFPKWRTAILFFAALRIVETREY